MADAQPTETYEIAFEAFGVTAAVEAGSADVLKRVEARLPPGSTRISAAPEENRFSILTRNGSSYRVSGPGSSLPGSSDLDVALEVLESELRAFIATQSPAHIFVHAGVVEHAGHAILIPGRSFSGKTTLVAEFVRQGHPYYSDEFAVLDREGLVHPYPKPLSIRLNGLSQTDHDISALGGRSGTVPLRIGLVIFSEYSPDARWQPQRRSGGDIVLALLANTIPASDRPQQTLSVLTRAVGDAIMLEGPRAEAAEVVHWVREQAMADR
jgi:hypothetical protein